jgi:hypothetical protein
MSVILKGSWLKTLKRVIIVLKVLVILKLNLLIKLIFLFKYLAMHH